MARPVAVVSGPVPTAARRAGAVGGGARRHRRAMGSRELGIDLASGRPAELFKWFLACLLFGKPIQQDPFVGRVTGVPRRQDIPFVVDEAAITEFYAR